MKKIIILFLGLNAYVNPAKSEVIDTQQEKANFKEYQSITAIRTQNISIFLEKEAKGVKELIESLPEKNKISPEKLLKDSLNQSVGGEGASLVLQTLKEVGHTDDLDQPSKNILSSDKTIEVIEALKKNAKTVELASEKLENTSLEIYKADNPDAILSNVKKDEIPPVVNNMLNAPTTELIRNDIYTVVIPQSEKNESFEPHIIGPGNDIYNINHASVALLKVKNSRSTGYCSGTLVDQKAVLTSAHCFCDPKNTGRFDENLCVEAKNYEIKPETKENVFVYFQHEGKVGVTQIKLHPSFTEESGKNNFDLAIIILEQPVKNIEPAEISKTALNNKVTKAFMSGYGLAILTNEAYSTLGLKTSIDTYVSLNIDGNLISNYSTVSEQIIKGHCPGDSGGPIFILEDYSYKLIGVITSGMNSGCDPESGIGKMNDVYLEKNEWFGEEIRELKKESVLGNNNLVEKAKPFFDNNDNFNSIKENIAIASTDNSGKFNKTTQVGLKESDKYITVGVNASIGSNRGIREEPITLKITDSKDQPILCQKASDFTAFCRIEKNQGQSPYKIEIQSLPKLKFQLVTAHYRPNDDSVW
ncbi:MAG: trypsin-like serine protease [Agitococcus sp.]|nr:trypsin-like serine protease [Agitococcus sp.]